MIGMVIQGKYLKIVLFFVLTVSNRYFLGGVILLNMSRNLGSLLIMNIQLHHQAPRGLFCFINVCLCQGNPVVFTYPEPCSCFSCY